MIFSNLGKAVRNTYVFGLAAIIVIVLLGIFIAYLSIRRKNVFTSMIDTLTMFPYIIPGAGLSVRGGDPLCPGGKGVQECEPDHLCG